MIHHIATRGIQFARDICSLALILAVCLLANGCALYCWSDLAPSVTGHVFDKSSGERIAGACITYRTNYAPYVKTTVTAS